jgi:hypothetical protein
MSVQEYLKGRRVVDLTVGKSLPPVSIMWTGGKTINLIFQNPCLKFLTYYDP